MRRREAVYGFRERYDDLNNAYKKALSEGDYSTQYDAMAVAVNMPSKRFWVSEERLVEVINAIEAGRDVRVSHKSPRYEMFQELYSRYLEYKAAHPELSKLDICSNIIWQPAPKFYMKPSWGLKILHQGRGRRQRNHHLRNHDSTTERCSNET